MKAYKACLFIVIVLLWSTTPSSAESKEEDFFIGLLHKLQFVEKYEDLKALIPNCPLPTPDAGEDNTEVIVKTKLFGFDAQGEFNFHKNVLVSHGMTINAPTYKDAHDVFLHAASILDDQVDGIHMEALLPFGLDGGDGSDGTRDQIYVGIVGENQKAAFGLALRLRSETVGVGWGAQQVSRDSQAK